MCVSWEAEAHPIATITRLVVVRSGVVLDAREGALKKMVPPFKLFVGGPIASGRQSFSWIHRDDWTSLVAWAISNASVDGPINACSPNPVTNREFASAMGRALHRPAAIPVPAFVLKLMFGEMATIMLIKGQRVVPKRAPELGFRFAFPKIDEALEDVLGSDRGQSPA
jgi:hypothetical protein